MTDSRDSAAEDPLVRELVVMNRLGVHARPAALIVKLTSAYDADVEVEKAGTRVSGKSIMGLLTLEAGYGCRLTVSVTGPGAAELMSALAELIQRKFDED